MVCIGFDLSTSCSGYGVFDNGVLIDYGAVVPHGDNWREKIMDETMELAHIITAHHPDKIYVEDVPKKPGNNTLMKLGAVQGMILALCAGFKVSPEFLLPNEWRRKIGLYDGTREGLKREILKEKAVNMANSTFGLELKWCGANSKKSQDDVAEAILIAYSQIA